jgi:hypothetical protein
MKDKFYLGLLYGAAIPLLAYVLGEMIQEENDFWLKKSTFYILCIALNVVAFRFAIVKKYDNLAKGILFITFAYAMIFFFYYFKQY